MAISVKITNVGCEAACVYCYEHTMRETQPNQGYGDIAIDAVLAQVEKEYEEQSRMGMSGTPYLHGGEALLAGHETVEAIMKRAYELAGHTNIQTYGYLIDDRYIEMFKKYNCAVGISVDGPWPLNKARPVKGMDTREVTETVMQNIVKLREAGIQVSVIVVLTKANAAADKLPILKEWIKWLRSIGVDGGRLNLMHTDAKAHGKALELTPDEAEHAWRELTRFVLAEEDGLAWYPMRDAINSLMGTQQGTCIFGACEYYHATAETVVMNDGTTANCLKTAKTGHAYPRKEQPEYESRGFGKVRYEVLQQLPMAEGGCGGCPYWQNCLGGCPSEGVFGGDWRSKTRFCQAYKGLFDEAEKHLRRIMPQMTLTTDPHVNFPNEYTVRGMTPPYYEQHVPAGERPKEWDTPRATGGGWISPIEHQDGTMTHLDSDAPQRNRDGWTSPIEHYDGTLHHLDSNAPGRNKATR